MAANHSIGPRSITRLAETLPKFRAARTVYRDIGLAKTPTDLDRLVSRNAGYTLAYYWRLACLRQPRYRHALQDGIRPDGIDNLRAAQRRGRGMILVAPHLGDFDLAVAWIATTLDSRPVVPVARLDRPFAQRYYDTIRSACGFDLVGPRDASVSSLAAQLRAGRAVILTLDRRGSRRTVEAPIFGKRAKLPAACLTLARRAGAPLLSTATWTSGGERLLVFGEPFGPGTNADLKCDSALMERLAAELEAAIRAAPHQWHIPAQREQLSFAQHSSHELGGSAEMAQAVSATAMDRPPLSKAR